MKDFWKVIRSGTDKYGEDDWYGGGGYARSDYFSSILLNTAEPVQPLMNPEIGSRISGSNHYMAREADFGVEIGLYVNCKLCMHFRA